MEYVEIQLLLKRTAGKKIVVFVCLFNFKKKNGNIVLLPSDQNNHAIMRTSKVYTFKKCVPDPFDN